MTVTPGIPFNRLSLVGREMEYVAEAVRTGHVSGAGGFTSRCQELLERLVGSPRALLTTSCTHALEMAALLLDLRAGDEVVAPSFTFVSTVNAFVLRGARPVFADVRPDTLNIDETRLEPLLSARTKAILVVHYAGVACEMDDIMRIADRRGVPVVEDNAHGLLAKYRGRSLGTFGAMATQSFHETKNISCGEGGALLINDRRFIERAEIVREKGTNRSSFRRGQTDKYSWVDIGSSYVPSDMLAAFLLAQLESRDLIQSRRRRIWERYQAGLVDWAATHHVTLPTVPPHCEQPFHMYFLRLPSPELRDRMIAHLKRLGILSVFHYLPLHLSPFGLRLGGRRGDCPVTEEASGRLLRLPFFHGLDDDDQSRVIEAVRSFVF